MKSNWNNCLEYNPNNNIDCLIRRVGKNNTIEVCSYNRGWFDEGGNSFETNDMIIYESNTEELKQYEWCYIPE